MCTYRFIHIQVKNYCWFLGSRIFLIPTNTTHIVWFHLFRCRGYVNELAKHSWSMCNHARLMDRQNGNATDWLPLVSFFRSFVDFAILPNIVPHRNRFRTNLSPRRPRTECDVRIGWSFCRDEKRTIALVRWSLLCRRERERRLRDNHVMWRQTRGLPGSCL